MQLVLWIGLCVAASILLRSRPRVLLAAVLTLWFLVPAVGNSVVTGEAGGALGFHAASWLVVSVLAGQLLHDPWSIKDALARHFFVFLVLALVIVAAFLASRTSEEGGGMLLLVDQIMAPVLFFLLLIANSVRQPGLVKMLRSLLLFLVAVVCVIAVAQWLNGDALFYAPGFRSQYWFNPETQRWMGTLDQPLALSLVICVAAPLVAGLKRNSVQVVLLVLMIVGVLITQSRVGLAAVGVSVVLVVFFADRKAWVKAIMLAFLGGVAIVVISSPLVVGVSERLADDTGSAEARALALEYFLTRWADYAVAGQGIGSSYRVAVQAGLETSFENPILMYSIDFGIFFAVLYFGLMLVLLLRNSAWHDYRGLTFAGLLAVVIPQTYSSLATRSVAGIVVWTILAMVVIAGDENRVQRRMRRAELATVAGQARAPAEPAAH
ncbi:hypothetical protein [Arthrobacter sp. S39]|uniref:hypothetical protein n=1 Tax=Arthrobacter sp. S39 TaxID=2509720 RepID=UPI0013EFAFC7|nr:hypothetical protein [Arthrobacter sp. S39]